MRALDEVSWVKNSIRPYESFWSIFQRFFALNVINSNAFAKNFFMNGYFNPIPTACFTTNGSFNRTKFFKALSISKLQEHQFYLDDLQRLNFPIDKKNIKYCPECIKSFYHTVLFQIDWLKKCPNHDVDLIHECSNCGSNFSTNILPGNISLPYSCTRCKSRFLDFSYKDLISPPRALNPSSFKPINEWRDYAMSLLENYMVIAQLPYEVPESWFFPIYRNVSKRPYPPIFSVDTSFSESIEYRYTCNAKPVSYIEKHNVLKHIINGTEDLPNMASVFKSYRRHLIKDTGGWGKALMKRPPDGWRLDFSERSLKLFAILLMSDRIKSWGRYVIPKNSKKYLYLQTNFTTVIGVLTNCKNSEEANWVILHAYFEELRWLHQQALKNSLEFLKSEFLFKNWQVDKSCLPCSFVTRDDESNQLVFNTVYKSHALNHNKMDLR